MGSEKRIALTCINKNNEEEKNQSGWEVITLRTHKKVKMSEKL